MKPIYSVETDVARHQKTFKDAEQREAAIEAEAEKLWDLTVNEVADLLASHPKKQDAFESFVIEIATTLVNHPKDL